MLIFTLSVTLISVTRSLFLATMAITLLAALLRKGTLRNFLKSVNGLTITSAIAGALLVTYFAFPEVALRWVERLTMARSDNGMDLTTLTRLAEIDNQLAQWSASTTTIFFGKGLGATYELSALAGLEGLLSTDAYDGRMDWFAGHNFWVYSLFSGGLLFGIALPLAILYYFIRSAFFCRRTLSASSSSEIKELALGTIATSSMILATIGGNPLGARYSGLLYGVFFAVMVYRYKTCSRTRDHRSSGHPNTLTDNLT